MQCVDECVNECKNLYFRYNSLPYMGAQPYDPKKIEKLIVKDDPELMLEQKIDGVYMTTDIFLGSNDGCTLRSGRKVPMSVLSHGFYSMNGLRNDINELCVASRDTPGHLVGELVLWIDGQGFQRREVTSGYLNSLMQAVEKNDTGMYKTGHKFYYFVWAMWCSQEETYSQARWNMLRMMSKSRPFIQPVESVSGVDWMMEEEVARTRIKFNNKYPMENPRLDGFIYKLGSKGFKAGKPSWCVKCKPPKSAVMRCVGYKKHTKQSSWIGSLRMVRLDPDSTIELFVGSGMTEADRKADYPSTYHGKLVLIEYEDVTEPNAKGIRSLTLPRFVQLASASAKATTLEEFLDD